MTRIVISGHTYFRFLCNTAIAMAMTGCMVDVNDPDEGIPSDTDVSPVPALSQAAPQSSTGIPVSPRSPDDHRAIRNSAENNGAHAQFDPPVHPWIPDPDGQPVEKVPSQEVRAPAE